MLDFPFVLPSDSPFKATKGSYFEKSMQYTQDGSPVNLTGIKFQAMFRDKYKSETIIVTLTTENGGIVITDAANGRLKFVMSLAQTDLFTVPLGTTEITDIPFKDYVFDADIIPVDTTKRQNFLKGVFRVYAEVTR